MSDESAKEGGQNMSSAERIRNIGTPPEYMGAFNITSQPGRYAELGSEIKAQLDPNLTSGMDQQPLTSVDQQAMAQQEQLRRFAEIMQRSDYRSSMTIIGSDLISEIQ